MRSFRYDAKTRQRLKTIELVIERTAWEPPAEKFFADTVVALKIEGYETELRKKVKEAGGKWKPDKRLWYVRYGNISGTSLEKHLLVLCINCHLDVDACIYIKMQASTSNLP